MVLPVSNTRRDFLKTSGSIAAASTLLAAGASSVRAYAGEDNTIQLALVGCGGRGGGAATNALKVKNGPIKLVAMADVFENKLKSAHDNLAKTFKEDKLDVPEDRRFVGFDGYKKAMDCLKPGDVVILTTPPAFRWVMFTYAIEKGLNVFMEKPLTVDAPANNRMLELNRQAMEKNLKVGVGLMCRHCPARQELFQRIQDGEIGELNMLRAYRMAGPTGSAAVGPKSADANELLYQISNFHGFLWLSGGAVSDFLIHNIDESCWMKNDWPVEAVASGGRHYRGNNVDQNFDNYSIEYTFKDGAKLLVGGRTIPGCYQDFASYAHGTKGSAVISTASHWPALSRTFSSQSMDEASQTWAFPRSDEKNPYDVEWEDLIAAIRNDEPYNEVERGVMASAVTSMGRMAAHTGQKVTLDQFLKHDHEFAPGLAELTLDSPAPLQVNAKGLYPIPLPGLVKNKEYA